MKIRLQESIGKIANAAIRSAKRLKDSLTLIARKRHPAGITDKQHSTTTMNVYACKGNRLYGSGLILVAANTAKEAYSTYQENRAYRFLHKTFNLYPESGWYQVVGLQSGVENPTILEEDSYIYAE